MHDLTPPEPGSAGGRLFSAAVAVAATVLVVAADAAGRILDRGRR